MVHNISYNQARCKEKESGELLLSSCVTYWFLLEEVVNREREDCFKRKVIDCHSRGKHCWRGGEVRGAAMCCMPQRGKCLHMRAVVQWAAGKRKGR